MGAASPVAVLLVSVPMIQGLSFSLLLFAFSHTFFDNLFPVTTLHLSIY